MPQLENASPIGPLLEEISWEGNAKPYREGGRGRGNVLTVEAFTPLDYLPRTRFGQVIGSAHGADGARPRVVEENERAKLSLLPGDVFLGGSGPLPFKSTNLRGSSLPRFRRRVHAR